MMFSFFNFFRTFFKNFVADFYVFICAMAEYHFRAADAAIEFLAAPIRPLFSPYARYFHNNYALKSYIIYLISIISIIGFFFYWEPYFFYLFVYFELFAFFFSSIAHEHSRVVRLIIFIFFFGLAMLDVFTDISEPLVLLHDASNALGLSDSLDIIGTHLSLQELVDGSHFWFYYFFVFFAPYLCVAIVIFAPLASAIFAFFFGYLIGYRLIGLVSSVFNFFAFVCASYILFLYPFFRSEFINLIYENINNCGSYFCLSSPTDLINLDLFYHLVSTNSISLNLNFGVFIDTPFLTSYLDLGVDSVSAIFIFIVTFISFLVHLYSIEYMKNDPHTVRFFGLLSFFTFSMLVLVSAADLVILFIGWEGVGLSSFLLISFWYTRVPALKSALKAILMNKIGDMFLLFAIVIIGYFAGGDMSVSLAPQNITHHFLSCNNTICGFGVLDFVAILLTLSAFVKSAQLFFHTWLPDAMEGPTPVSALLHAATMVTAGVYLIIRFSFIIELSHSARLFMLFMASLTLVVTSLIALFQYDIKKIIAYSTCGQLSMMFIACSLSGYDYALFHFFNHAFFKCLLFLLAGLIIHELKNEQDIRRMGNLSSVMPFTFYAFTLALISSIGFPFFSGAASKDLILALLDEKIAEASLAYFPSELSYFFYVLYFLKVRFAVAVLTSFYMFRLYYYVFLARPNYRKNIFNKKGYVEPVFRSPIYGSVVSLLVFLSLASGKIFKNFFIVTECNYVDIHNDILCFNTDTLELALRYDFHYVTHFTILCIVSSAALYFFWVKKNGHISIFPSFLNFIRISDSGATKRELAALKAARDAKYALKGFIAPLPWDEIGFHDRLWLRLSEAQYNERRRAILREQRRLERIASRQPHVPLSVRMFRFFNKRCYFDDIYNYFVVYSLISFSNYIRLGSEKGLFIFLADFLTSFVQKISSMSGYVMPKGFLINFAFIISFFATLWFWF